MKSYADPLPGRVSRVLSIPPAAGGGYQTAPAGPVVSPADRMRSDAERARLAGFDAQAGTRPLGGYEGDAARFADRARLDPASNPNLRPATPASGESEFMRQQLLALGGSVEGRVYTPATLARATDAQVAGELAATKPRNEMLDSFLRRQTDRAASGAGFPSYAGAAASLPPGVTGKFSQDNKTGRWFAGDVGPQAGFSNAEDARRSIPEGSRGQVTQTAGGRWVVQYQVGAPEPAGVGAEPIYSADGRFYASGPGMPWKPVPAQRAAGGDIKKTIRDGLGITDQPGADGPAGIDLTKPISPEQAAQLPPGTRFIDRDGKPRTAKAKQAQPAAPIPAAK